MVQIKIILMSRLSYKDLRHGQLFLHLEAIVKKRKECYWSPESWYCGGGLFSGISSLEILKFSRDIVMKRNASQKGNSPVSHLIL